MILSYRGLIISYNANLPNGQYLVTETFIPSPTQPPSDMVVVQPMVTTMVIANRRSVFSHNVITAM